MARYILQSFCSNQSPVLYFEAKYSIMCFKALCCCMSGDVRWCLNVQSHHFCNSFWYGSHISRVRVSVCGVRSMCVYMCQARACARACACACAYVYVYVFVYVFVYVYVI